MILTGKAKEDFLEWLRNMDYKHFEKDKLIIVEERFINNCELRKNALIIEWFDSVGIYINIRRINSEFMSYIFNDESSFYKKTRQKALTKAIKKANEIYNSK